MVDNAWMPLQQAMPVRVLRGEPTTACGSQSNDGVAIRRADLAFQRAMLAAIGCGAEHVERRVIKSAATRYIRHVRPASDSGYRSSAGYTADMGDAHREYP